MKPKSPMKGLPKGKKVETKNSMAMDKAGAKMSAKEKGSTPGKIDLHHTNQHNAKEVVQDNAKSDSMSRKGNLMADGYSPMSGAEIDGDGMAMKPEKY